MPILVSFIFPRRKTLVVITHRKTNRKSWNLITMILAVTSPYLLTIHLEINSEACSSRLFVEKSSENFIKRALAVGNIGGQGLK